MPTAATRSTNHIESAADLTFSSVAVCFRCAFESKVEAGSCPQCGFPLIHQEENTPSRGAQLSTILSRDTVRGGAPLLPGVDPEKRQAQLMREARQKRRRASSTITEERIQQRDAQRATMRPLRDSGQREAVRAPSRFPRSTSTAGLGAEGEVNLRPSGRLQLPFICVSAALVGVLAAVLQGAL